MNKKIEEILKDLFKNDDVNGFILSDERFKELKDYIISLQTRIDKAIKLINIRKEEVDNGIGWVEMRTIEYFAEYDELSNILKGKKNEINWQERYLDLEERIFKALHLIKYNDIYDYSVFEEKLKNILKGNDEY